MKLHIHIGLPKTGVTLLSYMFEKSKNVNFLGRPLNPIFYQLWQSMIFDKDKIYNKKTLLIKNEIIKSLSKKKQNILLIEGITDVFFIINSKKNFIKRLRYLKKILGKNVNIQITFVLRKQSDFFISRYVESNQFFEDYNYNWKNFNNFKKNFKNKKLNSKEKLFFENFKYFKICKNLFNSFQKRNVNILMYEDLKNNKKKFANKISKIFELNLNETYKFINKNNLNKSTNLNKKIFIRKKTQFNFIITNNRFYINFNKQIPRKIKDLFKEVFVYIDKLYYKVLYYFKPEEKIYLTDNEANLIKNFYYNDNKKVDKYFNIGLKKNNYY